MAATKTLSLLLAQLLFEVLSESTMFRVIWVIQGCKGVGDFLGVCGGSGESDRF